MAFGIKPEECISHHTRARWDIALNHLYDLPLPYVSRHSSRRREAGWAARARRAGQAAEASPMVAMVATTAKMTSGRRWWPVDDAGEDAAGGDAEGESGD